MNKMFKLSSIAAALLVSGLLIGCGSSSSDDSNTSKVTPTDNTSTVTPTDPNATSGNKTGEDNETSEGNKTSEGDGNKTTTTQCIPGLPMPGCN